MTELFESDSYSVFDIPQTMAKALDKLDKLHENATKEEATMLQQGFYMGYLKGINDMASRFNKVPCRVELSSITNNHVVVFEPNVKNDDNGLY